MSNDQHSSSNGNNDVKKADAYSWFQQMGLDNKWHDAPGNWIKYEDYMTLWDAYRALKADVAALLTQNEILLFTKAHAHETTDLLDTVRNTIRCRDAYVSDEIVLVNLAEGLGITLPVRSAVKASAPNGEC